MTLLFNAVRIADKVTKALKMQTRVTLKMFVSDGGKGDPTYKSSKYDAIVERKQRQVRSFSGELVLSTSSVTFVNGTVNVGEHDVILLPDGSGGPVVGTSNPMDEGGKLITEAYLG